MRIALAVVAAVAALAGASSAAPGFDLVSWSDLDHGWAATGGTLYSTNDGGRNWRPIFTGGPQIYHLQRTSASAGAVLTGNSKTVTFWTRDSGRHWYRGGEILGAAVGHGGLLFATSGSSLLQIKPWPPRGELRCRGPWWSTAFGPGANPKAPKNICGGPEPLPMRESKVLTLTKGGELAPDSLVPVPAGIAGVSTDASPRQRPLAVVVYRAGQTFETPLTVPFPQDVGFSGLRLTVVAWPDLTFEAMAGPTRVIWDSADGGATWSIVS